MKTPRIAFASGFAVLLLVTCWWFRLNANAQVVAPAVEFATIRWDGRDNTHIVRPGGQVEFVAAELKKLNRPDRCDSRAFYMNFVMNGLAKEGWEFAGISSDDIVMRRTLVR